MCICDCSSISLCSSSQNSPLGSVVKTLAKYSFRIFALTLLLSTVILLVSLGLICRLEIAELDFVFDFVYFQKALGLFLVVFFFTEKNYLMSSLAMSVRPSVRLSVCPSSVEISLERGCSITNMPIDLKFGTIIGGRVMHVCKKFGFEIRIASCEFMQFNFFFVITVLTNLLFRFS